MPNPFGGLSGGQSFGIGLASSFLDTLKSEHDKSKAEETHNKELDYEVIMQTIRDPVWQQTHTPSQRQYMMEKAIDLLKPKGHTGLKEKVKEIFGGGQPYTPQAGNVMRDTEARPRANVTATIPGGTEPSVFKNSGVTLPPPPSMTYHHPEQTYGEMDDEAVAHKQELTLQRQLAAQTHADLLRNAQREAQNKEVRSRAKEMLGLKTDAEADLAVKRQLTKLGMFEDTPENRTLAAESLRQEREQKKLEGQSKLAMNAERMKQIDANISATQERLKQGEARLSLAQRNSFTKDPQVVGSWVKVREYANLAKTARTQAAIVHGKIAKDGDVDGSLTAQAAELEKTAEGDEAKMQQIMDAIGQRQDGLGVKLPDFKSNRRSEDPATRAYADKYFKGDYAAAEKYKREHP